MAARTWALPLALILLPTSQAADALATWWALGHGATEVNPLFGHLTLPQLVGLKVIAVTVIAVAVVALPQFRRLPGVAVLLSIFTCIAAAWNLLQ